MTASCAMTSADNTVEAPIKTWWVIESYASLSGIGEGKTRRQSPGNVERTTKFVDGERYEVGLNCKRKDPFLPINLARFWAIWSHWGYRLSKDSKLKKLYQDTIKLDIEKGFVRLLKQRNLEAMKAERQWYVNPYKLEKVRRVFEAAYKFAGASLDDNILTWHDLLQFLIGETFRFREQRIAITADIEEMILQVRSTWRWQGTAIYGERQPKWTRWNIQIWSHIFGAKRSLTCSNYALLQVTRDIA